MPSRNTIEVIIQGEDRASDVLNHFNDNLGSIGQGIQSFGNGVTGLGLNITALGAPFLAVGAIAQNAYDEMDDAADQLDAVLKSTGGAAGVTRSEVLGLGVEIQNLTGITRAQIVGGENMLLTFTNIGQTVFPRATRAATDLSVAMKQDMKSSAIQLGKALNDPITGITALTRVGVTFTQSQKDMIKSMVDAGNVAGAQGIILTEIEREFGGSAAAAADPIDLLGTTINDLAIDVGVALQPVLESVIPVVQDLAKRISEFLTTMTDNGDNTVGIILAIGAGLAIIGPVLAAIGIGITAIGGLISFALSPIGLLIAAAVALFLAFQSNFLGIQNFLKPIIEWFQTNFGDVWGAIQAGVPIIDILRVLLFRLLPEDVAQGIVDGITSITNFLTDLITKIGEFVTNHPAFVLALGVIAGAILAVNVGAGLLTTAFGLLQGALALLFSPIVILIAALVALLAAVDSGYPGGIPGALRDAATSAQQLWFIFTYFLNQAVGTVRMAFDLLKAAIQFVLDKINEFINNVSTGANGIAGIINLLTSGQISLGDLGNAIGAEINGAQAVAPAAAGGGSRGFGNTNNTSSSQNITVNFNGTGGPTNQQQAQDSAHMLVGAIQDKGLKP